MLKKYALFGILVVLVALGISALSIGRRDLGGRKAVRSVPAGIVPGFQTPPMTDFVPSTTVSGFRTPPMSDFVPSIVKTGLSGYSQHNELRSSGSLASFAENLRLYELRYTAR